MSETTAVLDRPATLQQGTRQFTTLYETNAYLVYNLALRTTCDRATAMAAARSSFLAGLANPGSDEGLVKTTVSQALAVAADRPATPNGAGDAEAEAMLAASVAIPAAGRAALALIGLGGAETGDVAEIMGLSGQAATSLIDRSFETLAQELHKERGDAESAYRSWLCAEPAPELWETLYPDFYRAFERLLREGQNGHSPNGAAAVAVAEPERATPPRRWRLKRRTTWALAILAAAGGGSFAAERAGLIGSTHNSTLAGSGGLAKPQTTFGPHMSPSKLDQLRMRELQQTRKYAAGKASAAEKQKAAAAHRKALELAAKRRKAALAKQQLQRRRKLAAQRRQQQALLQQQQQQPAPAPAPPKPQRQSRPPSTGGRQSTTPQNQTQANQSCLYNADSGTYVCPR
jgi:hypothetical protein